jgi:hypothetical protein
MKKLIALGLLAGASTGNSSIATAADFGIGLSVKSNDATIFMPIDVSQRFRIEPSLNYSQNEIENANQSAKVTSLNFNVGLFGLVPTDHSVQLYYGARVGYARTETETNVFVLPIASQKEKSEGYRVAPIIGFEYLFNPHLSLGGEVGWVYSDLDEIKSNSTTTNVILRYKF